MNKAEKPEYKLWTLTRKSVGAALFIALGDFVLLKLGQPIGPFLFALGLLGVCYMKQNLFTGQCGFVLEDRIPALDLLIVLLVNLGAGWLFGFLFSAADTTVAEAARESGVARI